MIPISKPLINEKEKKAIIKVLESGIFACGPIVDQFEKQFSSFVGTRYAVATNSGTAALHLSLIALGIKKPDEVIIPDFSFIATANAPTLCLG